MRGDSPKELGLATGPAWALGYGSTTAWLSSGHKACNYRGFVQVVRPVRVSTKNQKIAVQKTEPNQIADVVQTNSQARNIIVDPIANGSMPFLNANLEDKPAEKHGKLSNLVAEKQRNGCYSHE